MAASRYSEDFVNMKLDMMAEGINNLITKVDGMDRKFDWKMRELTRKINGMEHKMERITRKQEYHDGSIRRLNRK